MAKTATVYGSRKPSYCQVSGKQTDCAQRAHNLINLLSQTRAYAHEIAFTGCNPRYIRVAAPLNKNNKAVRTYEVAIWPVQRAQGVGHAVD